MKKLNLISGVTLLIITLSSCSKNNDQKPIDPTPTPVKASKYVYVLNRAADSISLFEIESDGSLNNLTPATVPTGDGPTGIIIDAARKYLYVSNEYGNSISQYSVAENGQLTSIAPVIATGSKPLSISMSPKGHFLYAMNYDADTITRYAIGTNGVLTFSKTIAAVDGPASMAFSPDGNHAYVVNDLANVIAQFNVDSNGDLTPMTPASLPSQGCMAAQIGVGKTNNGLNILYVMSCPAQAVEAYSISESGHLTMVGSTPTGINPNGMVIAGNYLYVAVQVGSEVEMFGIQPNGTLNALTPPTIVIPNLVETLAVNSTHTFAYVVDSMDDKILTYSISANGVMSPVPAIAPKATGGGPGQLLVW
jgi:6-phosphogluconolactonase (cycloisomerase 2 family)